MKFTVKEEALNDTLPQVLEFIDERLTALKHDKRKALKARLMSEEALVSLMEHGDLCVSAVMIVMGMPGMPGAGIIGLTILLQQAECPAEAVGIMMGIEPLVDMARTAVNLLGSVFAALVAAKTEGFLDVEQYNHP